MGVDDGLPVEGFEGEVLAPPKEKNGSSQKVRFTDKHVQGLRLPKGERQLQRFETRGRIGGMRRSLCLSVTASTKTWRVLYYARVPDPKSSKMKTISKSASLGHYAPGTPDHMSVARARDACDNYKPLAEPVSVDLKTLEGVCRAWFEDYAGRKQLRRLRDIGTALERYVYPSLGKAPIFAIRRSDIAALLRDVERKAAKRSKLARYPGAPMADKVLTILSSVFRWYSRQDDRFSSPIAVGMKRDERDKKERERSRVLSDDELRALWQLTDPEAPSDIALSLRGMTRMALLTAQRIDKVKTMKREHVVDGVWTIAMQAREKGNAGVLRLPEKAADVVRAMPVMVGSDYVFPSPVGTGRPWANPSVQQRQVAEAMKKIIPGMERWTFHDLRRTARSLMSRAGIRSEIAERVLGHTVGNGSEGVYDRYDYADEKAAALAALANLIGRIVHPPTTDNVIAGQFREARSAQQ